MKKMYVFQPVKNCYTRGAGKQRCVYCGHGNYKDDGDKTMHYKKCPYRILIETSDKSGPVVLFEFNEALNERS